MQNTQIHRENQPPTSSHPNNETPQIHQIPIPIPATISNGWLSTVQEITNPADSWLKEHNITNESVSPESIDLEILLLPPTNTTEPEAQQDQKAQPSPSTPIPTTSINAEASN